MRGFTFLVLAAVAGIGFTATTPKAEAQVSVSIGVAVLRLATMVRRGLTATVSLASAPGFMAVVTSRVM